MNKNSKVLISGAGVSGLACGLWLAKAGFKPTIVEKASSIRAGGYLVSLSESAYHYAEKLELIDELKDFDIGITASSYHDRSGRSILDLDYARMITGNIDVIQMMRDDFVKILYDRAVGQMDFRFGDRVEAIEPDGSRSHVTFQSGKQEEFDVVIGCDGLHSSVRNASFDSNSYTEHYLGLYCAAFRLHNVFDIADKFETHMEKDRYMATFTTREGDLGAVFVWADEGRAIPKREARHGSLMEAFEGTTDAIKTVLQHCPADGSFYMDALCQIEMPTWHSGNSVLVGDAAHCLTLFSGRGAAAAFAGAGRLSEALVEYDKADAFKAYETSTMPLISRIQPATRNAVRWYVPRSRTNYLLRDAVMRFTPNFVFRRYFRNKYSQV